MKSATLNLANLRFMSLVTLCLLTLSASAQSVIQDGDNDTSVDTRPGGGDPDRISFRVGGTEHFSMPGPRLEFLNTGQSVFIGQNAGAADNLTNNLNAFIGTNAGRASVNGANNTAIGYNALRFSENNSNNTAIGPSAMLNLGAGSANNSNTAIGPRTLIDLTGGTSNTAIGPDAGGDQVSGSFNTYIGPAAGRLNQSGSSNVMIGQAAGRENVSGSGNVFLGSEAGRNETGSNKLYISNSSTSNPLIKGDFATSVVTTNGSLEVREGVPNPLRVITTNVSALSTFENVAGQVGYVGGAGGVDRDLVLQTSALNPDGSIKLGIQGSTNFEIEEDGKSTFYDRVTFTDAANPSPVRIVGSGSAGFASFQNSSGVAGFIGASEGATKDMKMSLSLGNSTGAITFNAGLAEHMRIANNGDVGINTDNPTTFLDIVGDRNLGGSNNGVIDVNYTPGTQSDAAAVRGIATEFGNYGHGGFFAGGWRGVYAGGVNNGTGTVTGLLANASGTTAGARIGVYAEVSGTIDADDWAIFSDDKSRFSSAYVGGAFSASLPTGYILAVDGKAIAEEVKIQDSGSWPDYVFAPDYELPTLEQVKAHIDAHRHLPNVPSAAEIAEEGGAMVGEMQRLLLEKVEELTLYLIEANQQIEAANSRIDALERQLDGTRN